MNTSYASIKRIAFPIAISICSFAVSFGAELPSQVQQLVERRQESIGRIGRVFVDELEKIKISYTKAGDLKNANQVSALIEQTKSDMSDGSQSLDGEWKYQIDGKTVSVVRKFKGNKLIDEGGIERHWIFENDGIKVIWNSRQFEKLIIDPTNPNVLKGANFEGTRFTYTRIK